jgi:hypothetical protein
MGKLGLGGLQPCFQGFHVDLGFGFVGDAVLGTKTCPGRCLSSVGAPVLNSSLSVLIYRMFP